MTLEERVERLEAIATSPIDALITERAEVLARLWEVDPHGFSSRPCQTCTAISALLKRPFGCDVRVARAERK